MANRTRLYGLPVLLDTPRAVQDLGNEGLAVADPTPDATFTMPQSMSVPGTSLPEEISTSVCVEGYGVGGLTPSTAAVGDPRLLEMLTGAHPPPGT